MTPIPLPITNGFYVSESLPVSAQECVNWYPVVNPVASLSQEILIGTPGISQLATSGTRKQGNRGGHVMDGVAYFVNGLMLYRLNADFTVSEIGAIAGAGRVSMADNGTQLMVLVPGGNGYIYNKATDAFVQITDTDFTANGVPQYVVFIDGYFVVTTSSKKFIVSALNNGISWNALDRGTAESDPDDIVAPVVYKNQLFITGSQTTEAFQNLGGGGFPFQRNGLFLSKGVFAPFSLINTQDSFMFIGGGRNESPAVWSLVGNGTQKISTPAIENILQRLTKAELTAVYAWVYAQKGAYFVGFALPDSTIVYDIVCQRWHERKSYTNSTQQAYRVSSIVTAYGKVICSDTIDGRFGSLDPDVYTEYGANIVRTVATQPFQNNMKSMFVPSIELTVESGVGNAAADDPVITMDRSKDGKTWQAPRPRKIGKVGEYGHRAIWRRNGRVARFEVFRFTLSDPVKPVIIQLTATIVGGDK